MGYLMGSLFSETLNMDTDIGVILPQDSRYARGLAPFAAGVQAREKPRALILLHGLTDNSAAWAMRSRILSYAEEYNVAVIMPSVQRSFYQDMANGEAYFTYVSDELPRLAAQMFNLSIAPEDLMVAGLSMGGYGALRCGLTHPDRYRAVGAFSSAVDIEALTVHMTDRRETLGFGKMVRGIFGERPAVPMEARLDELARRARGTRLPILMTCGTEDELYPSNTAFHEKLAALGYDVDFQAWPGIHEWGFWDKSIQLFLERHAK